MAYADQSVSGNRIVALIIVAIIHVAVGYALVTGLAYQGLKKVIERVTTVDVEEPPPPSDEPPPPPPNPPEPRGRTSNWVTTNDYPRRALREEQEGTTRVSLTVGLDGKVEDCTVTGSSGFSELDDAVCKNVTRRARFKPGTRDGKEVVTTFPFAVTWRIPDD